LDGLTPTYAKLVAPHLKGIYDSAVESDLLNSRQAHGTLPIDEFRALHLAALAISLVLCIICFLFWRCALPTRLSVLYLFLPLAIIWNAAVTGGLSGAYDRYLARVIWIIPLVAIISVCLLIRKFKQTHSRLTEEQFHSSQSVSSRPADR